MTILDTPLILAIGIAVVMACGSYLFFVLCRAMRGRRVLMWWGLSALLVAGAAWLALSLELQGRAALFLGLLLPLWSLGGLLGMLAGLIRYRKG